MHVAALNRSDISTSVRRDYRPAGHKGIAAASIALIHAAFVALVLAAAARVDHLRETPALMVAILPAQREPVRLTAHARPLPMALRPIAPVMVPPPVVATAAVADISATPIAPTAAIEAPKSTPSQNPAAATTPPRFDADYLDNPPPAYPRLSKRLNESGRTVLMVHVDADGLPLQVNLHTSSGYGRLDQAALDAVRRWRFIAAKQGDKAVAAWVLVPIHFALRP